MNSKQKNSKRKDYALCLGNISKHFLINEKIGITSGCKTFFLLIETLLVQPIL